MIEIRWERLRIDETPPSYAIRQEGQIIDEYWVLQYREWIEPMLHDAVEPEWQDVPIQTDSA